MNADRSPREEPVPPSLTAQLVALNRRAVSTASRHRALLHWLDWMGCVASAADSAVARAIVQWHPPIEGAAVAALLGTVGDPFHALLLDAGPANVEEMDDLDRRAILHPGPVVVPALALLARQRRYSAAQVLDALVRGYETLIRIGRAAGRNHYFHWHSTATSGTFGAAAAAADLLGLDDRQVVWALGNAGTQAAGLWQCRLEPVMSKQLHTAHAAWAGLTSASLATAGFSGSAQILEGERGFFAASCRDGDPSQVLEPADHWLIEETSFKPWPACRHTHATIDCVLALRRELGDRPLSFVEARVETFGDAATICDQPEPTTRVEAKFSLQYCVAAAAELGPLEPEHFDAAFIERPDLRRAARTVRIAVDPAIGRAYPRHFGARVVLRLADGRELSHEVADALGDPERPLDAAAVLRKAGKLMAYGRVAPARANAALEAVEALLADDSGSRLAAPFPRALLDPLRELEQRR
jgi:2-methylcitrate dehydratase PrpD